MSALRCTSLISEARFPELVTLLDTIFDDATPASVAKEESDALLRHCFEDDSNLSMKICEQLLPKIGKKGPSMYEQGIRVREILADHYESRSMYRELTQVLSSIPQEVGLRSTRPDFQLAVAVRLMGVALDTDDLLLAETHLPKALSARKSIPRNAETEPLLKRLLGCHAKILDRKRKFLDAAARYHELSFKEEDSQAAAESLKHAIICVMLADAGPQRSKVLMALVKDERTAALGDLSIILEKVHNTRIIRRDDYKVIESYLAVHQTAITPSGRTCLEVAVAQHNLSAISRFYTNIRLEQLGDLLGLGANEAERVAAQMILEGRLAADIDDVEGYIYFSVDQTSVLAQRDESVSATCNLVASISAQILVQHPQFRQQ